MGGVLATLAAVFLGPKLLEGGRVRVPKLSGAKASTKHAYMVLLWEKDRVYSMKRTSGRYNLPKEGKVFDTRAEADRFAEKERADGYWGKIAVKSFPSRKAANDWWMSI